MTSGLMRAACAVLLLVGDVHWAIAADAGPTTAQVETVRRQYLQALQQGDFKASDRLGAELKALEARRDSGASGLASVAGGDPVPTFFSPASGSPASGLSTTSSVFSPPGASPVGASPAISRQPTPAPKSALGSPAKPILAPRDFDPAPPPPASAPAPALSSSGTAAPAFAPLVPAATPASSANISTNAALSSTEPRPAEVPPAVIELRAAQAELSKLEEFRMAESLTTRRTAVTALDPARTSNVPPPAAVMSPAGGVPPVTVTPSVSLAGAPEEMRRKLDDLTRRKSELQLEAERLAKDSADWEARYNSAKAELARLEAENKGRERLQTIRAELTKLDADATRLMQDIEAGRADQERRAREVLTQARPMASFTTASPDQPAMTSVVSQKPATPERKGPPQFLPVGSSRPAPMAGEGGILRTGRSTVDSAAIQRELDKLTEKREIVLRELDEVQLKFNLARRELDSAGRVGNPQDIERWTKEIAALDTRYKVATEELKRIDTETQGKISAMKGAVAGGDPDAVNPGDSLRLIVTEDDSYNAIYPVKRDGTITVKNLGRVSVGGKKISEAEAAIKAMLEESQLTKATVTLEFVGDRPNATGGGGLPPSAEQSTIIYLAGEFVTPGPLKIPDGVTPTLITTIIRSGGITPSGDLTRTKLLRIDNGMGAVEEVNVAAILSGSIPPMDIALNPGDIIMIPAFAPVVYVTGNVTKPGTLRLFQDETLTAYAAILRAGGFSRFANLKKCYVVRDLGNGEKMQMPLNVKEIQRGLAPDIVLQGKDIVVVPESFFSF